MNLKNNFLTIFYILLFTLYQISLVVKGGTTWDDEQLINTSSRIINKFILFTDDPSNPFISEFVSNYEFYGYFVLIPIFLLSKNQFLSDLFVYITNNIFGLTIKNEVEIEYYLRYISLVVYVSIVLFIIYNIYSKIQNSQNAFYFIVLITLVPSFSGHMLFNVKDIPFTMQSTLSIIYFLYILQNFDSLKIYQTLISGFLFGFLLLTRLNGITILLACFVFSIIYSYLKRLEFSKIIKFWIISSFSTAIAFILGTPSAWQKPRLWLTQAIETQFNIVVDSYVLTNGLFFSASNLPNDHLLNVFFYKLPLVFHLSLIITIYFLFKNKFRKIMVNNLILLFSIYFLIGVNIGFYLFTPISYDGIRQFLFLIPFYCIVLVETYHHLNPRKAMKYLVGIFIVSYLVWTQYGLSEFKYIYFNEFTDKENISTDCNKIGGCGDWSTDYWGYSGKSLINLYQSENQSIDKIYFCEPTNVFNTFSEKDKENDINRIIRRNDTFFIAYLHRPMFISDILLDKNNICGRIQNRLNIECDGYIEFRTLLRGEPVSLSYVDKCEVKWRTN